MRAYLPDFRVINPRSLKEALEALAAGGNIVPLAGGTDLMVYLESGSLPACEFLNVQAIPDVSRSISIGDELRLGPLATFRDARTCPELREKFPLLPIAAREVGALAIQSRATWAGNIANASPAADGVPALIVYDAEVELSSRNGARRVLLADFYTGYKATRRRPDELITAIRAPLPGDGWLEYYRKVGTRRFQSVSKVVFAGRLIRDPAGAVKDVRIAVGSVAPITLRARATEGVLRGRASSAEVLAEADRTLQDEIRPIDDLRSTAAYRRRVASNLLREFISRTRSQGDQEHGNQATGK